MRKSDKSIKERGEDLKPKMKQRTLRAITVQEAIEISPILLSQYWKKKIFA